MKALRYLSTRIFGLIVCIFFLSGGQSAHAMGLEARVKDLHGSLVSLKKKLTALRNGLQEVKNSLAGKAYGGKRKASGPVAHPGSKKLRKQRPLPSTPHTSIETLIKSENRLFLASAAFSKIEHAETYKALEKVLLNNQGSLTEKEKEIIAYVIAILLHLNAELAKEKIEEIQENKPISSATKKIILNYFKSNFGKNSDAKALLERIKPKITMTEVAPSSSSLPVSGPAPLVTPVESPTPPVGGPKSPPPAPKLPDTPLSSGGSKSTPVKKPSVSGPAPAPVSITDQIKSKGGDLKKLSKEDIEKDKKRRAEELVKKQQEKDKKAGEASTQTKAAAADSMFESLKANLGKRAEAIQGPDDEDEDSDDWSDDED